MMNIYHSSYKRRLEILPSVCVDVISYHSHMMNQDRTGIIITFAWLTEEIMLEFP